MSRIRKEGQKMKNKRKILAILGIVVIAVLLIGWMNKPSKAERYESYIVQSGDTLWGIAKEFTPESRDCRYTIEEIEEVNGMADSTIYSGQVIIVPIYEEEWK